MNRNRTDPGESAGKAGIIAQVGALISAVLASACCWLPLLFIIFGVSGGALAAGFETYRPVLLPVTFILLGLAFYFTYRKPKTETEHIPVAKTCCVVPDEHDNEMSCCQKESGNGFTVRRLNRIMLWVVTVFVLAFAFFPDYAGFFARKDNAALVRSQENFVTWVITIQGMSCEACAAHIESELRGSPGVVRVQVDFEKGIAVVAAASAVKPSELRQVVEAAGYAVSSIYRENGAEGGVE